jgi:glycosyl transferase family 1
MRFFFTEEDDLTRIRATDLRRALVHARHEVVHGAPGERAPPGTDVWMHGLGAHMTRPMDASVVDALLATPVRLMLYQICDAATMAFERIPPALAERASRFLRNHWPSDRQRIPPQFRDRIGWMPPMLKTMAPRPGRPLAERSIGVMFYGTRTGKLNLPGGRNAREETVRLLRAARVPFEGGLIANDHEQYQTDRELLVPKIHKRTHTRRLRDTQVCVAPWGNHPLTYRFYEGLACRCLVLAQSLRECAIVDDGLRPGVHYVEVAADLSDLVDLVRHHLARLTEAQRIADAGHAHFIERLAPRGPLISQWLFDACLRSWGDWVRPGDAHGIAPAWRGLATRWLGADH